MQKVHIYSIKSDTLSLNGCLLLRAIFGLPISANLTIVTQDGQDGPHSEGTGFSAIFGVPTLYIVFRFRFSLRDATWHDKCGHHC